MVIVKNNGKGTTANRKLTTHSYAIYIYLFIGKYIYIYVYKYNTIILHGNSAHLPAFFIVIILEACSPEKCSTYRGRSVSIGLQHK